MSSSDSETEYEQQNLSKGAQARTTAEWYEKHKKQRECEENRIRKENASYMAGWSEEEKRRYYRQQAYGTNSDDDPDLDQFR